MLFKLNTVSALLFASASVLTGCGDDDDDTGSTGGGRGGSSGGTLQAGQGGSGPQGGSGGSRTQGGSGGSGAQAGSGEEGGSGGDAGSGNTSAKTSFFVTSDKSATGNLGGLVAADARCQALAEAVELGDKTWRAYLSVESDPANDGKSTDARDRIGSGPWYNAGGVMLASDVASLHALVGDADVFLDENGEKVPGQWPGSPTPNEHDILTGSTPEGTVAVGFTCADWTSESAELLARVGHSDGLGPSANPDPPYNSWNSSHTNRGCNDTLPSGGAGRIYCFAVD